LEEYKLRRRREDWTLSTPEAVASLQISGLVS
jgi:hypothetical protein